jgi:transcriptional regulator with XRE-family HTH domain
MRSRKPVLTPSSLRILNQLGSQIKLSRLRRKLSAQQLAERSDISRATLWQIEKGAPSVAMGIYCQVLFVLGLEKDLLKIAAEDAAGRKLMEDELVKKRAPKRNLN